MSAAKRGFWSNSKGAIALCAGLLALWSLGGARAQDAPVTLLAPQRSYEAYLARYADAPSATQTVSLPGSQGTADPALEAQAENPTEDQPEAQTETQTETQTEMQSAPIQAAQIHAQGQDLLWENGAGRVSWAFEVPETGLYEIEIAYTPLAGNGVSIERTVLLDGVVPFNEARGVQLARRWTLRGKGFAQDNQGNDIRPSLIEAPERMQTRLYSADGLNERPLRFYLAQGPHKLTLEGMAEPVRIHSIALAASRSIPAYAEPQAADVPEIRIQTEDVLCASDQTLYPLSDFANSNTEPFELGLRKINYMGGYNWRFSGQTVSWTFEAPVAGAYKLSFRASQNYLAGMKVSRALELDGQVPFAECEFITFPYDSEWQMVTLCGPDGSPYLFELGQGEHTLTLRATLGELSSPVRQVRRVASELTTFYAKVIMITGTVPDVYRDYKIEKRIVGVGTFLAREAERLREQYAAICAIAGGRVAEADALEVFANQLESLAKDPETLPARLDSFRENLSSLSTWIMYIAEQPLDIDYLLFSAQDAAVPEANPGFWQKVGDGVGSFGLSFTKDYTNVGNVYAEDEAITVWAAMGQDQAVTIKALIDERFTAETGIPVNFNILSTMDALLYAASSANPPDVILGVGGSLPVDYGVRSALLDLRQFGDYDEVAARFHSSAIEPFGYDGKVYALPVSYGMPVLFYRADILQAIGAEVPETWEQVHALIARLQEDNLTFGAGSFDMLLLQAGGRFYSDDFTRCLIDSPVGIEAFEHYTSLYTHYGLPQIYDAYNRFRLGEMPVFIADFSMYNTFAVAAPEIKGLWGIAMVPGTMREDTGTIDHTVAANATACAILSSTRRADAAWDFLKWYTSAEAQVLYGREIEATLGSGAKYASANLEAMKGLSWPQSVLRVIEAQREWAVGIPIVPGSYYIDRHIANAFREVVTLHELPREALVKYVDMIDSEIRKKREEFGLPIGTEVIP